MDQREKFNVWFNKYNFAGRAWNECMFDAWQAASQESAPVALPVATWKERAAVAWPDTPINQIAIRARLECAEEEIADLRAALAATPAQPLPFQPTPQQFAEWCERYGMHHTHLSAFEDAASLYLTAAAMSQQGDSNG